jgi:hypothetical protein
MEDDGRDWEELPPMDLSWDLVLMPILTSSFMSMNVMRSLMLASLAGRLALPSASGNDEEPPAESPLLWYLQYWRSTLAK